MNSFTAAPGEMPYDDECDGPRTNTTCPLCQTRFWKSWADSGGELCDACADAAWIAEKDRRRQQLAARVAQQVEQFQTVKR